MKLQKDHAYILASIVVVLVAIVMRLPSLTNNNPRTADYPEYYIEQPADPTYYVGNSYDEETLAFLEDRIARNQAIVDNPEPGFQAGNVDSFLIAIAADYESLGDYEAMLQYATDAVTLNPDDRPLLQTYSQMLYKAGLYNQAVKVSERSIELDPSIPDTWLWRAELEEKLRQVPAEASVVYERALEATLYDDAILIAHAEFLERVGDLDAAKATWQEAIDRYPDRIDTFEARISDIEKQQSQ